MAYSNGWYGPPCQVWGVGARSRSCNTSDAFLLIAKFIESILTLVYQKHQHCPHGCFYLNRSLIALHLLGWLCLCRRVLGRRYKTECWPNAWTVMKPVPDPQNWSARNKSPFSCKARLSRCHVSCPVNKLPPAVHCGPWILELGIHSPKSASRNHMCRVFPSWVTVWITLLDVVYGIPVPALDKQGQGFLAKSGAQLSHLQI